MIIFYDSDSTLNVYIYIYNMLKLFAGLGNPGPEYTGTRHNVGFDIIDHLSSYFNADYETCFQCKYAKITSRNLMLVKPMRYMNRSGIPVAECSRFFKIVPDNIFVFHDDLDLDVGRIKMKSGGSSGGHNGLKSLDEHIGSSYWRVRVGVSRPEHKGDVSKYVLQKFTQEHMLIIEKVIEKIVANIDIMLNDGPEKFLSKFYS